MVGTGGMLDEHVPQQRDALMATVVRIYRFRPLRAAFDPIMRGVILPDLARRPGVASVWAGRQGPDELGPRVVVSLWTTLEAMRAAMGYDLASLRFHPDYLEETTERSLEVHTIELWSGGGAPEGTILRIARGAVSDLAGYVRFVRSGVEVDLRAGHGPRALILAGAGQGRFVTASVWSDWDTLEVATGASVERPSHTKPTEQVTSFEVEHYEILPSTTGG
jgi:hypothetical protein